MTNENEALGSIERDGDQFVARLERSLAHQPTTVWAMLTQADKLLDWMAPGHIDLRAGGDAKINFPDSGIIIDSKVTKCDPPHVLEYSWSAPGEPLRPLRFEVVPTKDGCKLTLTFHSPADEDIARSCAGFEAHLMMLLAALQGAPIKFPFECFQRTRQGYNDTLTA